MKVVLEKVEPIQEALERMRMTPLDKAGNENIYIYKNANMRLADLCPDELNLTSLYILKNQLEVLQSVRTQLWEEHGIDILQLNSILHLRKPDGELMGMAPPVVEMYREHVKILPRAGDRLPPKTSTLNIPILKDGIHRTYIAKLEQLPIRCILISGALPGFMPYAYPNMWEQVRLCDEKPQGDAKKFFRRKEAYTFMRPLRALRQTGDELPPTEYNSGYRK